MIPKIIHYCWFGRNPLPESAQKCIASWRKFLPDYEIKEWNEDNFDVNIIPYTQKAYEAKKYAFVSDYARFWILYHYGGLYFDTDVEVIKPFDDIVEFGPFMGLEIDGIKEGTKIAINPGLCLGVDSGRDIYLDILEEFRKMSFFTEDGRINLYTMIPMVTKKFLTLGLQNNGLVQTISGINIYPQCYFNPLDDSTGLLQISASTHSIHWYSKTWMDRNPHWWVMIKRFLRRGIRLIHGEYCL